MTSTRPSRAVALVLPLIGLLGAARAQTLPAAAGPGELLTRLPVAKTLVQRGDDLLWEVEGGPSFRVIDAADGAAVLEVGGRRLSVAGSALVHDAETSLRRLPELVRLADAAQVDLATVAYRRAPLVGAHLKGEDVVVLPEGVARRVEVEEVDAREATRVLRQAGKALAAATKESPLSGPAQEALRRVLGSLHLRDAQVDTDGGALPPTFLRQMVRHGWLDGFGLPKDAVRAVADAVAAAERLYPSKRFVGDGGLELSEVGNAFGRVGVLLRSATRCGYLVELPPPQFFPEPKGLGLAVTLAPGSDPESPLADVLAAEVWAGERVVASWSRERGFAADGDGWRAILPESVRTGRGALLAGSLPPHVLVRTLAGDVRFLATAHGVLTPPRDGSVAEADRFLAEAAKVLPDAAHLDLIGNTLFRYSFDSPDPRYPLLVGDQTINGEIHQDAAQTLATVVGGIVRGDCDDLAELYQQILERQGKHAHLMSLPRHCAVCWIEPAGDQWLARVLQTGPGLQFLGAEPSQCLALAYQEFAGGSVVDTNQLGILLRFSGENVRTPYVLGWRVYAEPAYSDVMVDVQRDWHFHTFRNGYEKMKALVAAGDEDNANFRELSGLCQATGQFAQSAHYLAQAIERVRDPDAAVNLAIERMGDLFEAGQTAEGAALATEIIERMLPAAEDALGPATADMAMQLVARLLLTRTGIPDPLHGGGRAADGTAPAPAHGAEAGPVGVRLAARALHQFVARLARERLVVCYRYLTGRNFDRNEWAANPVLMQSRDLLQSFAGAVIECIEHGGPEVARALAGEMETVDHWLAAVAFREPVDPGDVLSAYAMQGRAWRALLGRERFAGLLEATPPATERPPRGQRGSGFGQLLADLPWIKVSVDYHFSELQAQFGRHREGFDRDTALRQVDAVLAARDAAEALGLLPTRAELVIALARLTRGLLTEDEAAVRAHFEHVRALNDKVLRDLTVRWLADSARALPLPWFERVLELWREVVDFKPSWFGIAWGALLAHAPEHALRAGAMGAERHADDPAFVAELAFLRRQLGKDDAAEGGR